MKILLLNPPNGTSHYINRDLMGGLGVNVKMEGGLAGRFMTFLKARSIRLPVVSLAYCATLFAEQHDVKVVDAANLNSSEKTTRQEILDFDPDWVLSWTSTAGLWEEARFVSSLKEQKSVTLGLLGDAATSHHSKLFEKFPIDFIVQGEEPEGVVPSLSAARDYRGLKGVYFRTSTGFADGGSTGSIQDLDALTFPKWELFPFHSYRYFPILRKEPFLPVLASRGCPYGCIYCPYTSNQGIKYRYRSVENVLSELTYLKETFGVRAVQFRDPTFSLRKDRTFQICQGIIDRKLDLEWGAETRIDCLDERLVDKMIESGLRGINFGIESNDPNIIRNVKRGWISPDLIQKRIRHLADHKVRISGFFILGLPGETPESLQKTIEFAQSLPLSYAEFKIATPFPGTPLFDLAKKEKWITEERLEDYTSYMPSMKIHPNLDGGLLQEKANQAYRQFYLSPRRVIKEVFSSGFIAGMLRSLLPANNQVLLPESKPIETTHLMVAQGNG